MQKFWSGLRSLYKTSSFILVNCGTHRFLDKTIQTVLASQDKTISFIRILQMPQTPPENALRN